MIGLLTSKNNIEKMYLGDNSALEVKGTGNVKIDNGLFKNVKLVPKLKTNILSVSQIASQGNKIELYNDKCFSRMSMIIIELLQLVKWRMDYISFKNLLLNVEISICVLLPNMMI